MSRAALRARRPRARKNTAPLACSPSPRLHNENTADTALLQPPAPLTASLQLPAPSCPRQKPEGKFSQNAKTWCGLGPLCPFLSRLDYDIPSPPGGEIGGRRLAAPSLAVPAPPPALGLPLQQPGRGLYSAEARRAPRGGVPVEAWAHRGDGPAAPLPQVELALSCTSRSRKALRPYRQRLRIPGKRAAPKTSNCGPQRERGGGRLGDGGVSWPRTVVRTDPRWISSDSPLIHNPSPNQDKKQ